MANSGVDIRDYGWKRTIDRLSAMSRARVDVGIFRPAKLAKYAAIHQHRFGWKTQADTIIEPDLPAMMDRLRAAVVDGRGTFEVVLQEFAAPVVAGMRSVISGATGLRGGAGLYKTGAMLRAVTARIKIP